MAAGAASQQPAGPIALDPDAPLPVQRREHRTLSLASVCWLRSKGSVLSPRGVVTEDKSEMIHLFLRATAAALIAAGFAGAAGADEEAACTKCQHETSCSACQQSACEHSATGQTACEQSACEQVADLFNEATQTAMELTDIRRMFSPSAGYEAEFMEAVHQIATEDQACCGEDPVPPPPHDAGVAPVSTFVIHGESATPLAVPATSAVAHDPTSSHVALFRETSRKLEELAYELECAGAYARSDALRTEAASLRTEARRLPGSVQGVASATVSTTFVASSAESTSDDCESTSCGWVAEPGRAPTGKFALEHPHPEYLCTGDLQKTLPFGVHQAVDVLESAASLFDLEVELELTNDHESIANGASGFWGVDYPSNSSAPFRR